MYNDEKHGSTPRICKDELKKQKIQKALKNIEAISYEFEYSAADDFIREVDRLRIFMDKK